MNVQRSLILKLMIYEFQRGHNAAAATKNICCEKDKSVDGQSTLTRWLKKICLDSENLDDQVRSVRPKTLDSEAVFQAIEVNLASNPWRVSDKLGFSQTSVVGRLHDLRGKSI